MALFLLANFLATLCFAFYVYEGLRPSYTYSAKYNVDRKLAKGNGPIVCAKAGRANSILVLALPMDRVYWK